MLQIIVSILAVGLSVYALYWVVAIVEPQVYRVSFLLISLVLTFLLYPARSTARGMQRVQLLDWILIACTIVALMWPLFDYSHFVFRAAEPGRMDLIGGALAIGSVGAWAGWAVTRGATSGT